MSSFHQLDSISATKKSKYFVFITKRFVQDDKIKTVLELIKFIFIKIHIIRMENDYQTPMKSHNGYGEGASTIAYGLTEHKEMAESKLERQGEYTQERENEAEIRAQQDKRLDEIEKQIQQIGQELRNIHYEIEKQADKYSEEILSKQRFRNQLRKKLIDLDYEHKQIISRRIQESRKLEQEKREQIRREIEEREQQIKEEREQRQLKRKEELDRYEQVYREKLREITESRTRQKQPQAQEKQAQEQQEESQQGQSQKGEQKAEGTQQQNQTIVEDELARSRRRLRIAEIESELAESRLRRSRIASLNAELDYLRYSYSDPYYVYSPYVVPSYYYSYPYSAYPSYSRWYY